MSLQDFIDDQPLIDHHCHFLIRSTAENREKRLAQVSTEADNDYPLEDTKNRAAWWGFQHEANKFAVDSADPLRNMAPDEYRAYNHKIFAHYHFETLLIDTGFIPADPVLDLDETADLTGTTIRPIFRIETTAEKWLQKTANFEEWWQGLQTEAAQAKANGYVGFKSIAAYRFGLNLTEVSKAGAQKAFTEWQKASSTRLVSPVLIKYILWNLAPVLLKQGLPLQFHVGYGDADTDMYQGNPLLMRAFLEKWCKQGLKVVLLHCYPYHREAGYLASVFPNLYFDTSLIDPLGPTAVTKVLNEALELAPYSRYLFASDASTYPEMYGLAALKFKEALKDHFARLDFVPELQKKEWIKMICHENARKVYGL